MKKTLNLQLMQSTFAVSKLPPNEALPLWALKSDFYSISKTPDELSVVCAEANVPNDVKVERGWRCLKVEGPLDFALTGVLASLVNPLAEVGISIFAISTFDTDFLLIKQNDVERALVELKKSGHRVV